MVRTLRNFSLDMSLFADTKRFVYVHIPGFRDAEQISCQTQAPVMSLAGKKTSFSVFDASLLNHQSFVRLSSLLSSCKLLSCIFVNSSVQLIGNSDSHSTNQSSFTEGGSHFSLLSVFRNSFRAPLSSRRRVRPLLLRLHKPLRIPC